MDSLVRGCGGSGDKVAWTRSNFAGRLTGVLLDVANLAKDILTEIDSDLARIRLLQARAAAQAWQASRPFWYTANSGMNVTSSPSRGSSKDWRMQLRQGARKALALALPRPMFLTHGPRSSGSVCLTFDDGPHPELTPRLLDILAREGAKGTFFVLGHLAERHPEIVKRMEAEGHTVGHHSYSHLHPTTTPTAERQKEVRRSREVVEGILGHSVRLYRPPHGKLRAVDFPILWAMQQTIVLWNVDPKDFAQASAAHITDWFASRSLCGGDLMLLHDPFPQTIAALPAIVSRVRLSGLKFCSVDQWTRWLPVGQG
jgi:peptidoglycan-N-acetylglucosamine deacetylase